MASTVEIPENGITDINEWLEKFPAQLSEKTMPLPSSQVTRPPIFNQLTNFKLAKKTETQISGRSQTYRTHITDFQFVDTKKVHKITTSINIIDQGR